MKSTGGPGALMFAVTIGLVVGGGAFFWLRQGDQEKIRKLESNYERMEARCNRAYEELDRVGQGATGGAVQQDSAAQEGTTTIPSNLVLRADFDALQQSNATLQTCLDGRAVSNAVLLAKLEAVTASNATLQAEYTAIQASNVLLQVAGTAAPKKDPVLQAMYDEAVKSNAHLQAEYEIVLQINDILRTEQGGLKSNSVSRLQFDDMQRSNQVLQAQYETSCRSNLALRAECDALLLKFQADQSQVKEANASQQKELEILVSSNAVLAAACEKSTRQNLDLEEKYGRLKEASVDRATYTATLQSNLVLQAQSESVSSSNLMLRAECDALLLKVKTTQTQTADENASLQEEVDALTMSNAVLVVACEKSVQQNIDLEAKYEQLKANTADLETKYERLKETSVDRTAYNAMLQSNLVLQAESTALQDTNAVLRTQVATTLQSNAVLFAECQNIKHVKQDGVPRNVHYDVLWSNAVLRTTNEALRNSSVPRAAYDTSVKSNTVLKAELANLTKRHIVQSKRYIKLGDRYIGLMKTHERAEELLKAYRIRFLRLQKKQPKAR